MTGEARGPSGWPGSTVSRLTWAQAHQAAMIDARHAHHDLRIDRSSPFVDVVAALPLAGVTEVMWRPLGRLFGAYVHEPGQPVGVLLNNGLPFAARRVTAAHELGHHLLRHGSRLDDERTVTAVSGSVSGHWSPAEKRAEAFATWFLMPPPAVQAALAAVTGEAGRVTSPVHAYQMALLLGVPYRTLLRHLPQVRLATPADVRAWSKVNPSRIRANLLPNDPSFAGARDVWVVTERHAGLVLHVRPGDRLVFPMGVGGMPSWLAEAPVPGGDLTLEVASEAPRSYGPDEASPERACRRSADVQVGAGSVRLQVATAPLGHNPEVFG